MNKTITQEEIEKAAEKYDDKHTEQLIHDMDNDSTSWKPLQDGIRNAFKAGVNFALGKQKKDAVISGWVARDGNGGFAYIRMNLKEKRMISLQEDIGLIELVNILTFLQTYSPTSNGNQIQSK